MNSPSFEEVNAAALAAYPSLLQNWLPQGRLHGHEFRVGSLQGEPGQSLSVNVNTGIWKDFAADDGGSDPVSLYAASNGLGQAEAKDRLAEELGIVEHARGRPAGHQLGPPPNTEARRARHIWAKCRPATSSPAQDYLTCRGILIPIPDAIRYHEKSNALVAAVTAPDGEITGIQRIYLDHNAAGVWRRKRLSLGRIAGGAVRLTPFAARLQLTESIEDGLALLQMTGRPTWAVPGAGFMESFEPPAEVREVVLAPDADEAGLAAIAKAAPKLAKLGLTIGTMLPPVDGADWCDMLELWDERAAIVEDGDGISPDDAELEAWRGLPR